MLTLIAGPASAQGGEAHGDAFFAAMSACLDWVVDGAPDNAPFDHMTAEIAFPGEAVPTNDVGLYVSEDMALSVSLQRSDEGAVCTGDLSVPGARNAMTGLEPWVAAETEAGRITMIPDAQRAEFGAPIGLCAGPTGAVEILLPDDTTAVFFVASGPQYMPPEGVCDA
ncbi:hypothetical protein [Gymnodinialimonas hymeniacidonis]|uniref:hypothetical protein n=1 Tax=Gymnodinialimonas hymeniacidonis TaxID=3126508 RepID=UPI0034C60617